MTADEADREPAVEVARWRVGKHVGRTIYLDLGTEDDPLIGVMDTPELAAQAVYGNNTGRRVALTSRALRAAERRVADLEAQLDAIRRDPTLALATGVPPFKVVFEDE